MSDQNDVNPYEGSEREFIHDLSNPLAIVYGNLRILTSKLEADFSAVEPAAVVQRLNKILASFDKANLLLEQRRAFLRDLE